MLESPSGADKRNPALPSIFDPLQHALHAAVWTARRGEHRMGSGERPLSPAFCDRRCRNPLAMDVESDPLRAVRNRGVGRVMRMKLRSEVTDDGYAKHVQILDVITSSQNERRSSSIT